MLKWPNGPKIVYDKKKIDLRFNQRQRNFYKRKKYEYSNIA